MSQRRPAIDTDKLRALVAAADAGSLSAAARALGAQLSTVSRQVSELERAVDAPLLARTGRGVRPTPAGERYVERARLVLQELDAAHAEARGSHDVGGAVLRIAAPVELSLQLMPEVLATLLQRHRGVSLALSSEARRVSLLEEDFDAAVRLGSLSSSQLQARRLGAVSLIFAARPARARTLHTVTDLREAEHVRVAGTSGTVVAALRGRDVRVALTGAVQVSTFAEAAALAALSDHVALLPSYTAAPWLRDGRLARALPALRAPSVPVHLLWPARHRGAPVLRDLGELVAAALARAEQTVGLGRPHLKKGRLTSASA